MIVTRHEETAGASLTSVVGMRPLTFAVLTLAAAIALNACGIARAQDSQPASSAGAASPGATGPAGSPLGSGDECHLNRPSQSPSPSPRLAALADIHGVFIAHRADGSNRTPGADVIVALYCESFLPGSNPAQPSGPLAVTITEDDGSFLFPAVPAGHYFLTTLMAPVSTLGVVVDVEAGQRVFVELLGCVDCPPPA